MKHKSFLRGNPAAYVVTPVAFALVTLALLLGLNQVFLAPYLGLWNWFLSVNVSNESDPADLLSTAVKPETDDAETIPLSSITYPNEGDRYATITIEGTEVNAPVYYGDNTTILNQGVGTYKDDSRAGIPGESKTILLAGHNNTFFNDLQSVEVGDIVTIETHYGTYTYTVEECKVLEYNDTSAYDFTRTDENLILYTCYPFDALGFTSQRYFVYASYTSGPMLDADN
ncbi:MAG: class D sortase [Gemmiger sp.]